MKATGQYSKFHPAHLSVLLTATVCAHQRPNPCSTAHKLCLGQTKHTFFSPVIHPGYHIPYRLVRSRNGSPVRSHFCQNLSHLGQISRSSIAFHTLRVRRGHHACCALGCPAFFRRLSRFWSEYFSDGRFAMLLRRAQEVAELSPRAHRTFAIGSRNIIDWCWARRCARCGALYVAST